jgi:glycyl-radical enzyme activating protein family
MDREHPLLFDIVRGSVADGEGIRTVVFMKGCPLKCAWCHNPESQRAEAENFYYPERCMHCGNCKEGKRCYSDVTVTAGRYYPVEELIEISLRDKVFYKTSGGGLTFTGGEPLLFIEYVAAVARKVKEAGVNILIETAGLFDFSHFQRELLPWVDTVFFDLKLFDNTEHTKYTGVSNSSILDNFRRLLATGVHVVPRIPLIPEITATASNLAALARFLDECHLSEYVLLSYNNSCIDKQKRLGRTNPWPALEKPMSLDQENRWRVFFQAHTGAVSH